MLAGGAEPLSIRDDHQRRPQAGRVVAAVAEVTQQDLQGRKRDVRDGRGPGTLGSTRRTHQLRVVGETTVLAGVVVWGEVLVGGRGGVGAPPLAVAIAPPSASLHLVVLVAVVLVLTVLVLAAVLVAGLLLRAPLLVMRPCVGPANLPSLPGLKEEQKVLKRQTGCS